jgi:hypothetical protein
MAHVLAGDAVAPVHSLQIYIVQILSAVIGKFLHRSRFSFFFFPLGLHSRFLSTFSFIKFADLNDVNAAMIFGL